MISSYRLDVNLGFKNLPEKWTEYICISTGEKNYEMRSAKSNKGF